VVLRLVASVPISWVQKAEPLKIIRFFPISICLILILGIAGCAPGPEPAGTAAPQFIPTPAIFSTPAPLQLENLHSFCVSITQDHAEGLISSLPDLLKAIGYEGMNPGEACDANLDVTLTGEAISASYQVNQSSEYRTCFTGAKFTGEIKLSAKNALPLVQPVSWQELPPNYIEELCPAAEGAPYQTVWRTALVRGLKQLMGDNVVIGALQVAGLRETSDMLDQPPYSGTLIKGLSGLLDNPDPSTRWHAARFISLLQAIPEESVIALSEHLTGEPDATVRQNLWGAIQNAGPLAKAVLPQIIDGLNSADKSDRMSAAQTLGAIGPAAQSAAPALVRALQDPESWVRMYAARSLGEIMAPAEIAVQPLINLLGDADSNVQQAAGLSLAQITNHPEMEHQSAADWQSWLNAPSTPTPVVTPIPEDVLSLASPAGFAETWQKWNGKYVVYVHRSSDIQQFSDLNGKWLMVALVGSQLKTEDVPAMLEDANQLAKNSGIAMELIENQGQTDFGSFLSNRGIYSNDIYSLYFLGRPDFVAFMLPEMAKYYHFDQNTDLIRVEFK
jgi:hypothetical protein